MTTTTTRLVARSVSLGWRTWVQSRNSSSSSSSGWRAAVPTKDVYKEVGYSSPFRNDEDKTWILRVANEWDQDELGKVAGKANAVQIVRHRQVAGKFEVVEQLLDVKNLGPAALERLGKKALSQRGPPSSSSPTAPGCPGGSSPPPLSLNHLTRYVKPKMSREAYKDVESLVALKLTLQGLAFAHLESRSLRLKGWDCVEAVTAEASSAATATSRSSWSTWDQPAMFSAASAMVARVPRADLYVFEEQPPILANSTKDPYLVSKVKLCEFQAIAMALLNCGGGCGDGDRVCSGGNKVHYMRVNVIDEMFGLKVGQERVSLQNKVKNMIEGRTDGDRRPTSSFSLVQLFSSGDDSDPDLGSRVKVDRELLERFQSRDKTNVQKEHMGSCVLGALAFHALHSDSKFVCPPG